MLVPIAARNTGNVDIANTPPGSASNTPPTPPSAAKPLPAEKTVAASTKIETPAAPPDLGKSVTKATNSARMQMPVSGAIIRPYVKKKNDGIDIAASAGTAVKAADAGTVAAITKDTEQVPILVLRHSDGLLTVYANIEGDHRGQGGPRSAKARPSRRPAPAIPVSCISRSARASRASIRCPICNKIPQPDFKTPAVIGGRFQFERPCAYGGRAASGGDI